MSKKEIMLLISGLEPRPLDEDILDGAKEAAYCKGYNDAITDVVGLLKTKSQAKRHKTNDESFSWNETIQQLYGGEK